MVWKRDKKSENRILRREYINTETNEKIQISKVHDDRANRYIYFINAYNGDNKTLEFDRSKLYGAINKVRQLTGNDNLT